MTALVLLSGGQDSGTCLAWAVRKFGGVETVGFDYGQRNRAELRQRQILRDAVSGVGSDHFVAVPALTEIAPGHLSGRWEPIKHDPDGIPSTFLPGRNLLFLTLAAAIAYRRDIRHIVTGVCETDYSGYPDCRDDTIKALQVAINLGMNRRFVLHTPLMWRTKKQTWELAQEIGGLALVETIRAKSISCYRGVEQENEWGPGCGECPACLLRAKGWSEYAA